MLCTRHSAGVFTPMSYVSHLAPRRISRMPERPSLLGQPWHPSFSIRGMRHTYFGLEVQGRCVALNLPVDQEDHARLIMGAGCWLLAAGCWLLAAGCSAASAYVTLDDKAHENAT